MGERSETKFKRGRKVCIFCGGTPISEEHIWPQWASSILPSAPGHQKLVFTEEAGADVRDVHKRRDRQGAVTTIRIKRVCQPCNSGWMGTYEETVRPFLEPMMKGERTLLSKAARAILAEYLTLKIMVIDWAEGEAVLPLSASHAFYVSRAIPRNLYIQLFSCTDEGWQTAYRSQFVTMRTDDNPLATQRNVKSFTIGFGNLLVFAIVSQQVEFDLEFDGGLSAVRLLPSDGSPILWPPRYSIDGGWAEYMATALRRLAEQYPSPTEEG